MRTICIALLLATAACAKKNEPITEPVPMPDASPFVYPVALWDRGVAGETLLMLHVTERGAVDSVRVAVSSGEVQFDSAAILGAPQLRFVPGRRGERPVAMWTRVPVRFQIDSVRYGR